MYNLAFYIDKQSGYIEKSYLCQVKSSNYENMYRSRSKT